MKYASSLALLGLLAGCATSPQIAEFKFSSGGVATMYQDESASYMGPGGSWRSKWTKLETGEYKVTWPNSTSETRCYPSGRLC